MKRHALVAAREAAGHTQAQVAKALGISEIYVRKIEAGDKTPGRNTIVKYERFFRKPAYELFPDIFVAPTNGER